MKTKDKGVSHFIRRLEAAERGHFTMQDLSALADKVAWFAQFRVLPKEQTDEFADRLTVLFELSR